ncbi:MAG: hypothetical protein JWO57_2179 [Pseudonocardiales bacterium]|nr:hypothetical protein [Pseudonocardiales bacterium]
MSHAWTASSMEAIARTTLASIRRPPISPTGVDTAANPRAAVRTTPQTTMATGGDVSDSRGVDLTFVCAARGDNNGAAAATVSVKAMQESARWTSRSDTVQPAQGVARFRCSRRIRLRLRMAYAHAACSVVGSPVTDEITWVDALAVSLTCWANSAGRT